MSHDPDGTMRRLLLLGIISIIGVILGGFMFRPAMASTVAKTEGSLRVSCFEPGKKGQIEWIIWDARSNQKTVFKRVPEVPKNLIWVIDRQEVYYSLKNEIFVASYADPEAQAKMLGTFPSGQIEPTGMWLDQKTRRLRILRMLPVPESGVIKQKDGHLLYQLESGKPVPGLNEPDWGVPYICQVWELKAPDQWTLVVQKGTKWEAGDTPGPDVVSDYMLETGRSFERGYSQDSDDWLSHRTEPPASWLQQNHLRPTDSEEEGLAQWVDPALGTGILFNLAFGDTLHAMSPVYYLAQGKAFKIEVFKGRAEQISFAKRAQFILITEEYTGDHPSVLDLKTGKLVWSSQGRTAVWIEDLEKTNK